MLNVEEQTTRLENLYRQLTGGAAPKRGDRPLAPIPPDANAEQLVEEGLTRVEMALRGMAPAALAETVFTPRIALAETEQEWRCLVELPGVRQGEVSLQMGEGMLRLSAHRRLPQLTDGGTARTLWAELAPCRFERAIPLPLSIKVDSSEAKLENGLLLVKFQKEPNAGRRDLKIEVA